MDIFDPNFSKKLEKQIIQDLRTPHTSKSKELQSKILSDLSKFGIPKSKVKLIPKPKFSSGTDIFSITVPAEYKEQFARYKKSHK